MDVSFNISPLSGWVGLTEFTFTPAGTSVDVPGASFRWNFGDGGTSKTQEPLYRYFSPGTFQVDLTVRLPDKSISTVRQSVSTNYLFQEAISFEQAPNPTLASHFNASPFRLRTYSITPGEHVVDLYALYSKSKPESEIPQKWDFLDPQWRFLDLSGNFISSIKTKDLEILSSDGISLGYTGTAEFYFIDDSTNVEQSLVGAKYTTILATLQTSGTPSFNSNHSLNRIPSLSNSKAVAVLPHIFLPRKPEVLNITENGKRLFTSFKQTNVLYPWCLTLGFSGNKVYSTGDTSWVPYNSSNAFCRYNPISAATVAAQFLSGGLTTSALSYLNSAVSALPLSSVGFVKTSFMGLSSVSNIQLSATTTVTLSSLSANWNPAYAWIGNPQVGTTSKVTLLPPWVVDIESISSPFLVETKPVSSVVSFSAVSGLRDNWCYAALPFPDFGTWLIYSDNSQIVKINSANEVVSAMNLDTITGLSGLSASRICLDSHLNLWISISNTKSAIKIDKHGQWINTAYAAGSGITTAMVTDTQDSLWISYDYRTGGLLNSSLYGYTSSGTLSYVENFAGSYYPNNILVDSNPYLWVLINDNTLPSYSNLQRRNINGNLLNQQNLGVSSTNMTVDANQNLWTVGADGINVYFPTTSAVSSISLSGNSIAFFPPNNILVAQNHSNKIWVINSNTRATVSSFYINPKGLQFWTDLNGNTQTTMISISSVAQAGGDWTGWEWINKYKSTIPEYTSATYNHSLSGVSTAFNIVSTNPYNIFKKNENYDLADQMQQLAVLPSFQDSSDFFTTYLGGIFGKAPLKSDDLGVVLYEKIANWLSNHQDIDTCNINSLYNLGQFLGVQSDDYRLNFPLDIQRWMDIASINYIKLRGSICYCQNPITPYNQTADNTCPFCLRTKPSVLGAVLSLTSTVTAGTPVILKDRSLDDFRIINTGYLSSSSIYYPISLVASSLGLETGWSDYYEFYSYVPKSGFQFSDGVIDWLNTSTSLLSSQSSLSAWVGPGQILDTIFTFALNEGLDLNS